MPSDALPSLTLRSPASDTEPPAEATLPLPSSEVWRAAFTSVHEVIVIMDMRGVILDVNPAFETVSGFAADEVKGQRVRRIFEASDNVEMERQIRAVLDEQGCWEGEIFIRRKGGADWVSQTRVSWLKDDRGQPVGIVAVLRDITQERQAHEQLRLQLVHMKTARKRADEIFFQSIFAIARACEHWESDTGRHLQRMQVLSALLGQELNFPKQYVRYVGMASVLHDVGKLWVPQEILTKPSSLTPGEWAIVQRHPILGLELVPEAPEAQFAREVVRHHHENYDGSGYPDGLKGDSIPLAARIVRVADSLDAMVAGRPYKAARPAEDALAEVYSLSGRYYCPTVIDALKRLDEKGTLMDALPVADSSEAPSEATASPTAPHP